MNLTKNIRLDRKPGILTLIFTFLSFIFIFCACSHDENYAPEPENEIDNLYIALTVNLPSDSNTRSTTENKDDGNDSSEDQLSGETNENKIETAQIYFFDAETKTQLCQLFAYKELIYVQDSSSKNVWTLTAKVEPTELRQLIGKTFNLYVVANPVNPVIYGVTEDAFLDGTFSVTGLTAKPVRPFGTNLAGQLCPMSNKEMFTVDALKDYDSTGKTDNELYELLRSIFSSDYSDGKLWNIKNSKNGSYISLERSIARVDYKDGGEDYTYELGSATDGTKLKIQSMQLFNIGKDAYLFRHTQYKAYGEEDGEEDEDDNPEEVNVFGREKDDKAGYYNWIVDCDWTSKTGTSVSPGFYWNQLTALEDEWTLANDGAFISTETLNSWKESQKPSDGYVRWHYITENTLPSNDVMTNAFATGIEFRMLVCDANGDAIAKQGDGENYRINLTENRFKEVEWSEPVKDSDNNEIIPGGYYITYRWLLRHNDEENNDAPMKIGVVRNNIYRVSVLSINDVPDPHEPDNYYMDIDIKVLAWAKHDIHVTF